MLPWDEDDGPFVFHFWFICPHCEAEWNEFRQLKCREDAEDQLAMCVDCFSEAPVEPCKIIEEEEDD